MDTPSLVIVGAPHFFSRTTLRPFGPSVTFTASARVFIPRSRPRRASSSNAINLGMYASPPALETWIRSADARDGRAGRLRSLPAADPALIGPIRGTLGLRVLIPIISTPPGRVQTPDETQRRSGPASRGRR